MTELHTHTHVCGCGQHMGSIPRAKGTKNILPLTLTRLINAILEPFTEKNPSASQRHTLSFQSLHFPSAPSAQPRENKLICGSTGVWAVDSSTTTSQLSRRLDRWCSPRVHLKSNERRVEWDYTHKAVHHGRPRGKLRKWEKECESCKDEVEQEGIRERRKKGNRGKSKLDTLT